MMVFVLIDLNVNFGKQNCLYRLDDSIYIAPHTIFPRVIRQSIEKNCKASCANRRAYSNSCTSSRYGTCCLYGMVPVLTGIVLVHVLSLFAQIYFDKIQAAFSVFVFVFWLLLLFLHLLCIPAFFT